MKHRMVKEIRERFDLKKCSIATRRSGARAAVHQKLTKIKNVRSILLKDRQVQ